MIWHSRCKVVVKNICPKTFASDCIILIQIKSYQVHIEETDDAVICQDENATVLYKQLFDLTEFDETHYLGDITKLVRNRVDEEI